MEDYSKLTVAVLKDRVKARGIPALGLKLKQHFIDALQAEDAKKDTGSDGDESSDVDSPAAMRPVHSSSSDDSESRKRKRRSPASSGNKRVKAVDADSNSEMHAEEVAADEMATHQPFGEEKSPQHARILFEGANDTMQTEIHDSHGSNSAMAGASDLGGASSENAIDVAMGGTEVGDATTPAQHPATKAVYIRGLVRPINQALFTAHVVSAATPPGNAADSSIIEGFYLDSLKTHGFVLFTSVGAAMRARSSLHDTVWPDEPMRGPLWVDYIPEDKVQEWADIERTMSSGGNLTRWEVVYATSSGGDISADLQQVGQGPAPLRRPVSREDSAPADAPKGPRADRTDAISQMTATHSPPPNPTTFDILDERFSFTRSNPKLYYHPVSAERQQRRLDALARLTSRDWNDSDADPANNDEREMHRFTFEGNEVVDNGEDFGVFGRRHGQGGRGQGYRGRYRAPYRGPYQGRGL